VLGESKTNPLPELQYHTLCGLLRSVLTCCFPSVGQIYLLIKIMILTSAVFVSRMIRFEVVWLDALGTAIFYLTLRDG
jgi:hypothetical protein